MHSTQREHTLIAPGPQGHTFDAPGGILGFGERYGHPSAAQHVVLLPGGYQSASCWRYQAAVLEKHGCYAVVLDLPGHGLASAPTTPYPGIYADYIAAALEEYALENPCLVAWSFGCVLATDCFLSDGASSLASAVFVGPAFPLVWDQEALQPVLRAHPWMQQLLSPNKETRLAIAPQFVQMLFGSPVSALDYDLAYGATLRNISHIGQDLLFHHLSFPPFVIQEHFSTVSLTMISGDRDPFALPAVQDSYRSLVPHLREIVLSGCGHSPHIEQPRAFNTHLFAAIGI